MLQGYGIAVVATNFPYCVFWLEDGQMTETYSGREMK
jgi:hypothetical protein